MKLFVVVDTLGAGRVVGVFDSREEADRVLAVEPGYYQAHECDLRQINPEALDWARTDVQREALRKLIDED